MEKIDAFSVFTPTSPARLTFVEREAVNSRLVDALRTPGMQIVVYGHSGSGKTTLLVNKLHQLYDKHITSRCMKGVTFEHLVLDAFDQLSPFYLSESVTGVKSSISLKLSQDYLAIKNQISVSSSSEENKKMVRILPPQLTAQALARFMGEVGPCCWVLEDFHKIPSEERAKLSQIMKVFMDMADDYRSLKVIAIGAVDTARQVIEYDHEMKNRVAEIQVPLMNKMELEEIITKGGALLNITFMEEVLTGISSFSNGMASVCHQLCLNVCTNEEIYETYNEQVWIDAEHLHTSLHMYLEQCSDTIKKAFDTAFKQKKKAMKFDNAKIILKAISEFPQEGVPRSEVYAKILQTTSGYPQGNMTRYINGLCKEDGGLLRYDSISGRYSFRDPIYKAFAQAYFSKNVSNNRDKRKAIDFDKLLGNLKLELDDVEETITIRLESNRKKT